MSKRAERRHHRRRIIKKFQRIYKNWDYENWKEDGIRTAARGSIRCGCSMCANPRRKHSIENGQITRKEQENLLYYKKWEEEE